MMRNFVLPILAIGAIAFIALRRGSFAKNLQYTFRSIALRGKLFSPKIVVTIGIQNPSNQTATIKSIVAKMLWNGAEFANLTTFQTLKILPNSETPLSITAEPSVLGLYDTIKSLIKGGLKNGKLEINGTANIDNLQVPLTIQKAL